LIVAQSFLSAADISGKVTDYATDQPIAHVRVFLLSHGTNAKPPTETMTGGVYGFKSVDTGQYVIRFDLTGYTPQPDDCSVEIKMAGHDAQVNRELMPEGASAAYYAMAGQRFVDLVRREGGSAAAYKGYWRQLRNMRIEPAAKLKICASIHLVDARARSELPLDQYLRTDANTVGELSTAFERAFTDVTAMPQKRVHPTSSYVAS
jgi:hypothetical protein